uniref:B box-type domain-containing protein n=1 Tax=Meloidogyne javanica TaxID=6303 RepID=A0A915MVT2_MELJA
MLWNFGTSSSVETDPLSSMLASIVRQSPVGGIEIRGGGGGHIRGLDFDIAAVDRSLIPHPNDQHQLMEHQHNFLTGNPASMVQRMVKCSLCQMLYKEPKVLACIEGLLSDYGLENAVQSLGTSPYSEQSEDLGFGSLKSNNGWPALEVFEGSHPPNDILLPSFDSGGGGGESPQQQQLTKLNKTGRIGGNHRQQPLILFCQFCQQAICRECIQEHQGCEVEKIDNVADKQIGLMERLLNEARIKQNGLNEMFQLINQDQNNLNTSFQHAKQTIDDTFSFLVQTVHEAQKGLYIELEGIYGYKQLQLKMLEKEMEKVTKSMSQTIEFTQRLLKYSSPTEVIVFKPLLDSRLQGFLSFNADANHLLRSETCEIRLGVPDLQQAKQAIITPFNQLRAGGAWINQQNNHQNLINSPPLNRYQSPRGFSDGFGNPSISLGGTGTPTGQHHRGSIQIRNNGGGGHCFDSSDLFGTPTGNRGGGGGILATSAPTGTNGFGGQHDNKWLPNDILALSQDLNDLSIFGVDGGGNLNSLQKGGGDMDLSVPILYPPRSQIKRQKMTYNCKFGEFGVMEGQFTEPSGVAVNAQLDIIVADTNNHRIQVFDREGRFKFHNQYGQFIRKFGAQILQHPRGVCVDSKGRIVVVECKVMRVLIFDMFGNILHKFSCSRYLEFPNGVCTTEKEEILISDNRAHSIKVFNYEGQFVRQIGGEGITNYPIGVGINSKGEIVVADNHNNFNLTIFSQDGTLIGACESKVKHAQCYDVALLEDSVVLASKDYRLYMYKYQQI